MIHPGHHCQRLLISGQVQGVGFRWYARRAASALGVTGWVRNLPDGRVEVHAAGPPNDLDQLKAELRKGPASSQVTAVEEEELVPENDWQSFDIVI